MAKAPVGHTCPDIDEAIKYVKNIGSTARDGMKSTEKGSDLYELFKDCEWYISDIIGILEQLRAANNELRGWGEEMANRVDELEEEVAVLEDQVNTTTP